jgi:hypothetical protein
MITVRRRIGDRTVAARCDPSRAALAEDALTVLERIATRDPLRAGMTVRFGWSLLELQDDAGGGWVVCEPDFDRDPLRDRRPHIDATLDISGRQASFARLAGLAPVDAWFDQYLVVAPGALDAPRLRMARWRPESNEDTGWTLSAADAPAPDPEALEAVRSYRLIRLRPGALAPLVAPYGFAVVLEGDRVKSVAPALGDARA